MDSFKSNMLSYDTDFNVRNLNITTYLSAPNFVNISNPHIHKAYRLFPKITATEYNNKIINTLNKAIPIKNYISLLSLSSELLDSMLDAFDPETGKPIKYKKILDWPCIKYDPKGDTLGDKILNFIPVNNTIKDLTSNLVDRGITATTLGSFLEVINQFVSSNITLEQFLEVNKHLENPTQENVKKQFELSYQGHYRSQEVNLSTDVINTNNKGSSDWYLGQLAELNPDTKEIPNLIRKQLKIIKEQYEVEHKNSKDYIFTNSPNVKVDDLREQILRLIEVSSEAKKILKDRNAYASNDIKSINSNLPTLSVYNLIAREEILQKIEEALNEEQFISISAFAGTGKTTLAKDYGRKQKKIVRFIKAGSVDEISDAYRQFAEELTIYIADKKKEEEIIRSVCNKIANLNSDILFILMNIPKDKAQAIITTKNNNLSDDIKNIKLLPFNEEQAAAYIKASLGNRLSKHDVSSLIKELESESEGEVLPYSLSKAVAYLKENKLLKINDYISYSRNSNDEQAGTILLLEILEKSPVAWQILQCSAYLDPDFISIDIFKELFLVDTEKLQEPVKRLEELSLMNLIRQEGQNGLQLHRLMQDTVKRYVGKHKEHAIDEQEIHIRLLEVLNNLFPILTHVPNEDWENAKILYPHVIKILNDNTRIDKLKRADLYRKLGYYNEYILCRFVNSLKYHEEALKISQELYQGNHHNIAISFKNVGVAYQKLGYFSKALKHLKEALKMRQTVSQGNHPDIANLFNYIGITCSDLGYNSRALEYLEEALSIRQAVYPSNHPDIASSLSNIGVVYQKLGNFSKALEYLEESLKIRQLAYQGNHHHIAISLNNVGLVYQNLECFSKALEYLEKALNIRQALYQGDHPDIAGSLNNVGLVYQNLGNISEGLEYFKKALEMKQALYQSDHPDIANSLNNVGTAYDKLGDIFASLKYFELGLKMFQELNQGNHLRIAGFFNNIGVAYHKLDDINKSTELYKQAYLMRVQTLGSTHPYNKKLKSYLEKNDPEFIRNNEAREFILQRGDFEEVTLEVKQTIQKEVLNKIYINATKAKWSSRKFIILGNWGVKGYLGDKYLAKRLGILANAENIEIAKMLCFEAACLGAINNHNKDFICVIEFAKAYPALINKIAAEHPEYFIDGSILRACINDKAILKKLLGDNNLNN